MQVRCRSIAALVTGALLLLSANAEALQCVPFAREISGISIRGDAWTWWSAAVGQYDRGQAPRIGAVVVFKKHGAMRHGHVAVVTKVINSREVLVDHANWAPHRGRGRGQISKMVAVTDVSPRNDWTEVRVWNLSSQDFGTRTYPTYGFIYPAASRGRVQQAALIQPYEAAAPAAPLPRLSPPGDPVLATADQQIAAALAADGPLPAAVEVKTLEAKTPPAKVEAKAEIKMAALPCVEPAKPAAKDATPAAAPAAVTSRPAGEGVWEDDQAAAKRFGAGHY